MIYNIDYRVLFLNEKMLKMFSPPAMPESG